MFYKKLINICIICKYTYKMSENYQIGCKFYDEKQYKKALEYYPLAADKGYSKAQFKLGYMYDNGYGVEKSYQKAVEYYQLAADQGLAHAQYNLGVMYQTGDGVEKSYQTALEYYQLAADQGLAYAQYNLGYMYDNGYGVEKSYQKAVEYYQLAADQGFANAQFNLGNMYASKKYIQYELLEHQKIIEHLKQQIEFLELQIKYQPGGSGYQETKKHFESLVTNE